MFFLRLDILPVNNGASLLGVEGPSNEEVGTEVSRYTYWSGWNSQSARPLTRHGSRLENLPGRLRVTAHDVCMRDVLERTVVSRGP